MIEKVFSNKCMKSFIPEIEERIQQRCKNKEGKCKDEKKENCNVFTSSPAPLLLKEKGTGLRYFG